VAQHHRRHGDGVKVIALSVPDVAHAYREAVARGARGLREPYELSDDAGHVRLADIATYGDTVHRFVDRGDYAGTFLPGFAAVETAEREPMLFGIDHIVGNVELGEMERWVSFYEDVFGMTEMIHFSDEAISTEYSALMSKVFWFSLEFGVVMEDGELRAYGAGILSSYGEIEEFRSMEVRPLDIAEMGTADYDITAYQPVLYRAESVAEIVEVVGGFFDRATDESIADMRAPATARQ